MSKIAGLVGALGAFGAMAYLMAPLPPEQRAGEADGAASSVAAPQAQTKPQTTPVSANFARVASTAPAAAPSQDSGVRLVQQIQTELQRLGCYRGAVDGRWSVETQQAMQMLGERVRVLRPVDTPDYIMLALARGQPSHVCGPASSATASRQPARLVPLASEPSHTVNRGRAATSKRPADVAPSGPRRATATATASNNGSADQAKASQAPAPVDRGALEENRMSLGAARVDPLRAGIDPRDPAAAPILRGPPPAGPRSAGSSGPSPVDAPQVAEREPRPEIAARPAAPSKPRSDWKRTVFNKLNYDGP